MLSLVHLIYMAGDKCKRQNACYYWIWPDLFNLCQSCISCKGHITVTIENLFYSGCPVTGGCYYWSQSEEDVTVFITLPPNACKADLNVAIKPRHLKVALNSGEVLLTGSPHGDIDVDGSTWIVTNEEIKSAVGEFVRPDQLRYDSYSSFPYLGDPKI